MTPTWDRQWLQAARQRLAELTTPPDEPITFADWVAEDGGKTLAGLADDGDQPWTPTVPNILHDQPPTGCRVLGPHCPWMDTERERVELEHIIDNAADLAYAQAWRAYPHKAWT